MKQIRSLLLLCLLAVPAWGGVILNPSGPADGPPPPEPPPPTETREPTDEPDSLLSDALEFLGDLLGL